MASNVMYRAPARPWPLGPLPVVDAPEAASRHAGNGNGNGSGSGEALCLARVPSAAGRVFVVGAGDDVERTNGAHPLATEPVDGDAYDRLRRHAPDEVHLVLGGEMGEERVGALGARLLMDGVAVHLVLPRFDGLPLQVEATCVGSQVRVSLFATREKRLGAAVRRAIDVAGSVVLLAVLSPVIAAVACLVWAGLGRPVVFAQERVGRHGRLFRLLKFRSMVPNAEEILRASPEIYRRYVASNYKLAEDEDPRVTRLGRFLRRTSLDELPQLWNVLRGDMSLVGPRPVVPAEVAEYGGYARLLTRVKPGLTGLWQVSGRSAIGYPERARLDLGYVGQRSLARDLEILLRTLPAVISRRGAL